MPRGRDLARFRARIGMVFQQFDLFPHMTALQNVMSGPVIVKKMAKAEAETVARDLLAKVGLAAFTDRFPRNLSGGQQQRVAIARAMAMAPEIMLFDEVTSALDPELVGEVLDVMKQLATDGTTMIVVTHEMAFARDVADQVLVMDAGQVVEQGRAEEVLLRPTNPRTASFLSRFHSTIGERKSLGSLGRMFPSKDNLTICFAHAAYQMQARFELRKTGIKSFQVWAYDDLVKRIGEADIVVASGMWKNDLIPHASKLKFIQSISSGMDQYSKEQLGAKGVRLRQRRRRQRPRRGRACDRAHPGDLPPPARGARQSAQEDVARHDRRSRPARGRARRQDAAGRRHGPHRQPSRPAGQGLRHEGDRHPPRSRAGRERCGFDLRHGRPGEAGAAGRHRGADLRAHARDHRPDERRGLHGDEARRRCSSTWRAARWPTRPR